MSLFDSVISEVKTRFGLGDSVAGTLLSALLSLVTNEDKGGISGFLNMFTKAGLGDVASSWVNSGANTSISTEQLESAVGASTIAGIADKLAVSLVNSRS